MNGIDETATKQTKEGGTSVKDDIISTTQGAIDKVKQETSNKADKLNETVESYKAKVSDNLSSAAEKVHQKSDTAQEFLNKKLDKANEMSHRAADAINASSEYVKNFDLAETTEQVKKTIKQKPEVALTVAGIFVFLVGLLIGRKTS